MHFLHLSFRYFSQREREREREREGERFRSFSFLAKISFLFPRWRKFHPAFFTPASTCLPLKRSDRSIPSPRASSFPLNQVIGYLLQLTQRRNPTCPRDGLLFPSSARPTSENELPFIPAYPGDPGVVWELTCSPDPRFVRVAREPAEFQSRGSARAAHLRASTNKRSLRDSSAITQTRTLREPRAVPAIVEIDFYSLPSYRGFHARACDRT